MKGTKLEGEIPVTHIRSPIGGGGIRRTSLVMETTADVNTTRATVKAHIVNAAVAVFSSG